MPKDIFSIDFYKEWKEWWGKGRASVSERITVIKTHRLVASRSHPKQGLGIEHVAQVHAIDQELNRDISVGEWRVRDFLGAVPTVQQWCSRHKREKVDLTPALVQLWNDRNDFEEGRRTETSLGYREGCEGLTRDAGNAKFSHIPSQSMNFSLTQEAYSSVKFMAMVSSVVLHHYRDGLFYYSSFPPKDRMMSLPPPNIPTPKLW